MNFVRVHVILAFFDERIVFFKNSTKIKKKKKKDKTEYPIDNSTNFFP